MTTPLSSQNSHDRGVSDLLAFTLTFSIIITGIALVTLGGLGAFDAIQQGATTDVAETSMIGFAETTDDHIQSGAPRRTTSMKLQGHGLSLQASTLNVTVDGRSTNISIGAFVRETDSGTDIVYTSGAVYRVQQEGLVVSRKPSFRCAPDSGSVYLSVLSLDGQTDFSSSGRLTIETAIQNTTLVSPQAGKSPSATTVSINVSETAYPDAWHRLFEQELSDWSGHSEPHTYQCTGINRAVVHNTTVDIRTIA
ncbi:DUF7289 family protein [Haloarcula argentinensis]|uniref:Flagellin n=1 Tax=Haloarcula argentinensis TaxID=43776 RepID=A0ABU2EZI2_HALAR|nr:hypothetical protein [Haloarcula argentinensis]EMA18765.1 hypothetical protein C443_19754 [Haloarcula argentinensis DSM 12282]MDS0253674.1 hypothetical protein [Haloarcula argentinensis]